MSDTPPDRKEAGDAPAAPRNPWVGWLMWLILTPVLYVLSCGPVVWLIEKHYIPQASSRIYDLLRYLPDSVHALVIRYAEWWVSLI